MMTLDELLGTADQISERFPSYEEFASSRAKDNNYANADMDLRDMSYTQENGYSSVPKQDYYYSTFVKTPRPKNFYEYVARQNNETNDEELYDRLESYNDNRRPVFDRNEDTQQMTPVFQSTKADQKVRGRLNVKGKVILGAFLALVVTTVSLVIAFAGKINKGTAVVPASNESAVVSTQSVNI